MACNAAKTFCKLTGFTPELASLEFYIRCLYENGLVEETIDVFVKLKGDGVCLSIKTWNKALNLFWQLYKGNGVL